MKRLNKYYSLAILTVILIVLSIAIVSTTTPTVHADPNAITVHEGGTTQFVDTVQEFCRNGGVYLVTGRGYLIQEMTNVGNRTVPVICN